MWSSQQRSFRPDRASLLIILLLTALPLTAQRDPVLKQVDLPHRYYYREMYLPQLTTGPNSAAWSSDSRSLVYSMAGTLWRQALDSGTAEQLTAGPGIRLPTRLLPRRPLGRLRELSPGRA